MSPVIDMPTDERGVALDAGFWSTEGELFDRGEPTAGEFAYMLENDSQAQALDLAISLILQSARFDIEAAPGDKGEAKFARDVLFKSEFAGGMTTSMRDVIAQMTDAIGRKRVYFEKVWKYREEDNKAVYHKLAWRPPHQCTVMVDPKNGSFNGFRQRAPMITGTPLDEKFKPNKAFVYIFRNNKRPMEGYSLFQTAFGDFVDKLKTNRMHNIHLQNFALGTVIGKYLGRLKGAARKFYNKLLKRQGGGSVMVIGSDEEVDFQSHTGAGAEFLEKLRYLDAQMAGSVMLGFLKLGVDSNVGSWALSKDHSDFFLKLMEAVLKDMADALTSYVIAPLIAENYGKDAAYPTWVFSDLSEAGMLFAAEAWQALVVSANKPSGYLWEQVEEKAAQYMGVDLEKLQKAREEEKKKAEADAQASGGALGALGVPQNGVQGNGAASGLQRSLEALVSTGGDPTGTAPANGQGNGQGQGA